jgi:hypothetical protein
MVDELNLNNETIRQSSVRFTKEGNVREVRPTQTHEGAEATEIHIKPRFRLDLLLRSQFSLLNFLSPKVKTALRERGFRTLKTLRKMLRPN